MMEDDLKNSLLTVCKLLDKFNVQYMLVGGAAVALNGYYRHSINTSGELTDKPDIDIWYNPTYGNYFNIPLSGASISSAALCLATCAFEYKLIISL